MTTGGDGERPFRILLVDDNLIDARAAQRAAAQLSVTTTVEHVGDGIGALHRLREHDEFPLPDLILLDLNIAGFDGFDILHMLKSDAVLRRIPVVVLSTSSVRADVLAAYDKGANAYVTKPTGLESWNDVIGGIAGFWLGLAQLPSTD